MLKIIIGSFNNKVKVYKQIISYIICDRSYNISDKKEKDSYSCTSPCSAIYFKQDLKSICDNY